MAESTPGVVMPNELNAGVQPPPSLVAHVPPLPEVSERLNWVTMMSAKYIDYECYPLIAEKHAGKAETKISGLKRRQLWRS